MEDYCLSSQNQILKYRGFNVVQAPDLGVSPRFLNELRFRINNKLCTHIAVTGEAGLGKSYMAIGIARILEGRKATGEDRFTINQVVLKHAEYMEQTVKLKHGKCIVFDEPGYEMGKRDWYKDLQKALIHTLESQRFLVHPLFLPIINMALLDKTIRQYLIQYQIHMVGRGHGMVYAISPSAHTDKVYHPFRCHIYMRMLDALKCNKDTCLGCDSLETCQLFRAQYERKKASVQHMRYEQVKDDASQKESAQLTEEQLESMLMPAIEQLKNKKGSLDVVAIRLYLREEGIRISQWKAYNLKNNILQRHKDLFEQ